MQKDVLTVGQAARIVKVAPRTLSKWCDAGILDHYRLPNGSNDRRIKTHVLYKFMIENGMSDLLPYPKGSEKPVKDEDGITRVRVEVLIINDITYLKYDGKLWVTSD